MALEVKPWWLVRHEVKHLWEMLRCWWRASRAQRDAMWQAAVGVQGIPNDVPYTLSLWVNKHGYTIGRVAFGTPSPDDDSGEYGWR